jgi:hypothetical protein
VAHRLALGAFSHSSEQLLVTRLALGAVTATALPASSWHARFGGQSEPLRCGQSRAGVIDPTRRSPALGSAADQLGGADDDDAPEADELARETVRRGAPPDPRLVLDEDPQRMGLGVIAPAGTTRPGSEPGADHRSSCGQGRSACVVVLGIGS